LILLDEVGTGTDPDEGAALGIAIVKHFQQAGATTIATTHYNPLKIWASQARGVLNGSVEFDERTLRPTFRLIVGVAGASAGLEIARRMNVPVEIIEDAKLQLDPTQLQASDYLKRLKSLVDEQEALRVALEDERQATAEKYANLDLDFAKRETSRRKEFENELVQVISEFTAESQRAIQSVQDKVTAARLKKETETRAAELRRSAGVRIRKQAASSGTTSSSASTFSSNVSSEKPIPVEPTASIFEAEAVDIQERDLVRIHSLNQEGKVESINTDIYTVLIGSLRFRARREELTLVKSAAPLAKATANLPKGVSAFVKIDEDFANELNIIGSTVDEAEDRVDKFLDAAFLAGLDQIRIVHGHGKGALRQAVANLLKGHTHVKSFAAAPPNQGGTGATLVELKR
jgi:DNA mismatch repair protein MutS2